MTLLGIAPFVLVGVACEESSKPPAAPAPIVSPTDAPEPVASAKRSPVERTRRSAAALRQSAERWRTNRMSECPTPAQLEAEKALVPEAALNDAWGTPFKIMCDESATQIVSLGPDRREGTADDVREGVLADEPKSAPPPTNTASASATSASWGAAAVSAVVRAHTPAVKRVCWESDAGAHATTASVQLTLIIAADGSVQSTSASGDQPVAGCVEQKAKTWVFPPPGATTTVNIPFRFLRQ